MKYLGHGEVVDLLIRRGADVNIRTKDEETPLVAAINKGNQLHELNHFYLNRIESN